MVRVVLTALSIAYVGHGTIYTIFSDGSGRQALLTGVQDNTFAWSSDGKRIAYTAGRWHSDESVIKIANADGSDVHQLTTGLDPSAQASDPTWSPDGTQLAFTAYDGDHWRIYVIDADGTHRRVLTRGTGEWENPDWSPDGRWIAFEKFTYSGPHTRIQLVRPDGTGLHTLATVITGPQCACPDWSPDGTKIAYQASPTVATGRFPEIYVMSADGTAQTQLTHNAVRDENPDWSPDGKEIAYYSEAPGNAEIYVMNADGTHRKRLTHDPEYAALPRWRPGG